MSKEKYQDLSKTFEDIESSNEYKEVELKNQLRIKLEADARRKIIFIWVPLVGFVIILILWLIANIPNYDKCYQTCQKKAGPITTQTKDDCQFFCKIKYQ